MRLTLTALTIAAALIASGAAADEVGRYVTIALPNGYIVITDTKEGKVKSCTVLLKVVSCSRWKDES